jgi:Sulfotransferase family
MIVGNRQDQPQMQPGPLFVVGMWRSGTSLLYALLNQHPQIGILYESDMLTLKPVFLLRSKSAKWLNKVDFWNRTLTRHQVDRTAIDPEITDLPGAFGAVARQYARKKGAIVWGCKSPNYYDRLIDLASWFPSAKFIVIWRDPADVLESVIRAGKSNAWFARPGMGLRALLGYRRMTEDVRKLERRRTPVFQLRYEDLIAHPAATMQAICDFLGLGFDPRMVALEGADRSAIYEGAHHARVKSSSIQPPGDRSEVLSGKLQGKLERYLAYWREQPGGGWPLSVGVGGSPPPASWWERTVDGAGYFFLRAADRTIPFVYALVPTTLWQKYRQMKSRHRGTVPEPPSRSRLADLSQ